MHVYSTKFKKNVNLPYAKVGKQVFRSLHDAETYCGENGLDPDSAIEYGNNPDLRNQCAEIAKYQKAVLRRTESKIQKQIEKLFPIWLQNLNGYPTGKIERTDYEQSG